MKLAVIGPICKDTIITKDSTHELMGAPVYYTGMALLALDMDCKNLAAMAAEDVQAAKNAFKGNILPLVKNNSCIHKLKYTNYNERIYYSLDDGDTITYKDIKEEIRDRTHIILGPLYYHNTPLELFQALKGKKLIMDNFGMFTYKKEDKAVRKEFAKAREAYKHLDMLFLDETEICTVMEESNRDIAARKALALGIRIVVVTKGSEGSKIYTKEKEYVIPAFPAKEILDTTGAGDSYMAGFIKATTLFTDLQQCGEFAAMVSTMCIERKGPFAGSTHEVTNRLPWEEKTL